MASPRAGRLAADKPPFQDNENADAGYGAYQHLDH
jgi:hypothetical protein